MDPAGIRWGYHYQIREKRVSKCDEEKLEDISGSEAWCHGHLLIVEVYTVS